MANTCEPVIKIVMRERAKVVVSEDFLREMRLMPKGNVGRSAVSTLPPRGQRTHRSTSRCLTSHILQLRNVETPYASHLREDVGEWASRKADRPVCEFEMSEEAKAVL